MVTQRAANSVTLYQSDKFIMVHSCRFLWKESQEEDDVKVALSLHLFLYLAPFLLIACKITRSTQVHKLFAKLPEHYLIRRSVRPYRLQPILIESDNQIQVAPYQC